MPRKNKFAEALADAETKLIRAKTDLTTFQRKAAELTQRIPKLQSAVDSLRALEIGTKGSKPASQPEPESPATSTVEVTPCGHVIGETCGVCRPKHSSGIKGVMKNIQPPRENVTDEDGWEGSARKQ